MLNQDNLITHNISFQDSTRAVLEAKIKRFEELKDLVKEYNKLRKDLKEALQDIPSAQIGDYKISGKWVTKKSFVMPECTFWDMRIKKV